MGRKPMMTSTPKKQLIRPDLKCQECCRVAESRETSQVTKVVTPPEYTSFDSDKFINASKFQPKEVQRRDAADGYTETCSFKTQTDSPITHSIRCQASPRMVSSSVQTFEPEPAKQIRHHHHTPTTTCRKRATLSRTRQPFAH